MSDHNETRDGMSDKIRSWVAKVCYDPANLCGLENGWNPRTDEHHPAVKAGRFVLIFGSEHDE